MRKPLFSIVLYVDQPDCLEAALHALQRQKLFLSSGQLILVAPEDTPQLHATFDAKRKAVSHRTNAFVAAWL